jgi:Immunoglobulin-like domain of bacterial spore germination/Sporulation and spore germination
MTTGPTPHDHEPDELGADRLRSVLGSTAATVQPTDGSLGQILTRAHHRSPWVWGAPVLAAAAAVVLVVGAGVYASSRGTASPQPPGSQAPTSSAQPSTPSTEPSPSSTQTGNGPAVALPVYYAGSYDGQTRLYREFVRVHTLTPAQDAIRQALSGQAQDPDYRTLWKPGTTLDGYTKQGATASVQLSSPPAPPSTMALQQIVYTVTASDPTVTTVVVSYGPGGYGSQTLHRNPAIDTLALVWLLTPSYGTTVHSPVVLSGQAQVFEATVSWEIDTPGGTVVTTGNAMTPEAFVVGPWKATVTLPPGQYVAKAYAISMADSSRTWIDSKPFTVR